MEKYIDFIFTKILARIQCQIITKLNLYCEYDNFCYVMT